MTNDFFFAGYCCRDPAVAMIAAEVVTATAVEGRTYPPAVVFHL